MSDFIKIIQRKREELEELETFVSVCANALRQAEKAIEMIDVRKRLKEALGEGGDENPEKEEAEREHAEKVAKFATFQIANGSPYLYSLCSVRLWTLLEAFVDELVVEAMRNPLKGCDQKILMKLKAPIIDFISASAEEQAELLAETLKNAVEAPLKLGIGKFESILDPVGLGGSSGDETKKYLFELSQVRNVIVHKGAIADRRFVDACPWLNQEKGKQVNVSREMFDRYRIASYLYIVEIRGLIDEKSGKSRSEKVINALTIGKSALVDRPPDSNSPESVA